MENCKRMSHQRLKQVHDLFASPFHSLSLWFNLPVTEEKETVDRVFKVNGISKFIKT